MLGADYVKIKREDIFERDSGVCHICKLPVSRDSFHVDHIIPISKGGKHVPENVATSHPLCNVKKRAKVFSQSLANYIKISIMLEKARSRA